MPKPEKPSFNENHRDYGYIDAASSKGKIFKIKKGQLIAGHTVGIMLLDVWYPLLPGNVVNACTYDFPVRMRHVPGADQRRMHGADDTLLDSLIETGKLLEMEGCRVICGACGYFGHFQSRVAAALDVPVMLSSLIQIPWIKTALKPDQKVGLVCADGPSLTPGIWESCGVNPDDVIFKEVPRGGEFTAFLKSEWGNFDNDKIREEVVGTAMDLAANPEVGAILLECSDMPPYAADVQRATNLPVFDFITLIKYAHSAVAQKPYEGYM
jgi:hypothetical protein